MLKPMAMSTPGFSSQNQMKTLYKSCELNSHVMECKNDHEEGEIPVASPSTGLHKRERSSPTGLTPCQCQKRVLLREFTSASNLTRLEPMKLSYGCRDNSKWTTAEIKALIEFILFHSTGDSWPSHKQMVFWTKAGEFVQTRSASDACRSGTLIRMHM